MFGLDPETKTRIETNPAEAPVEEEEPSDEEQAPIVNMPFAAQALSGQSPLNGMFERTYETQLRMMQNIDQSYPFFESQTLEFDTCAVLLGERMDQEDYSRSGAAYILFRDGAMRALPLPADAEGCTVCPVNVQQTDSNMLTYTVGTGNSACTYTINLSDRTASMTVGAVTNEAQTSALPLSETDIHNAIMANNRWTTKTNALYPFRTEAHHIWGTKQNGNHCTVYALGYRTTYGWGNGQPKRIYPEQVGSVEMVFEWDETWQLTSFWAPSENEDSISAIRNRFPSDIAAIVLGEVDSDVLAALNAQRHDAALQYYATLTDLSPAKTFTPADVNFSGKSLSSSPDEMTYEERLAWIQAGPDYQQTHFTSLGQYAEGDGCITYLGQWVGTPHMNQYRLDIRFADGTTAYLSLPDDGGWGSVPPDTMVFQNGRFIYEITFPTQEVTNEGETLVHIKGTYHYEVDLAAKTVSLTVLQ